VRFDDPTVAAEIVLFADLLHRILDDVEARLVGNAPAPTPPSA
jgi:hypothetical protein